jgi:flagellar biosynthesis component FlhA
MQVVAKILKHTDILAGIGLLVIVAMLMLPMPGWMLDLGLVVALGTSVMILLTHFEPVRGKLQDLRIFGEPSFVAVNVGTTAHSLNFQTESVFPSFH